MIAKFDRTYTVQGIIQLHRRIGYTVSITLMLMPANSYCISLQLSRNELLIVLFCHKEEGKQLVLIPLSLCMKPYLNNLFYPLLHIFMLILSHDFTKNHELLLIRR